VPCERVPPYDIFKIFTKCGSRTNDYRGSFYRLGMAKALTGSFYLTETVLLAPASADGTRATGSIDLSSYVDVASSQCVAIDQVDYIVQNGSLFDQYAANMVATDGSIGIQLTDLNPGGQYVRADSQSLVASGSWNIDQGNNVVTRGIDLYPDNFGPGALSEMFLVVNDTLHVVGGWDGLGATGTATLYLTLRCRARIIKIGSKEWMAIAIQSVAAD